MDGPDFLRGPRQKRNFCMKSYTLYLICQCYGSEGPDPGYEFFHPEPQIPDSGAKRFRIQGSTRHRIPDPDLQHCYIQALRVDVRR
jgi:hypothetical protein